MGKHSRQRHKQARALATQRITTSTLPQVRKNLYDHGCYADMPNLLSNKMDPAPEICAMELRFLLQTDFTVLLDSHLRDTGALEIVANGGVVRIC